MIMAKIIIEIDMSTAAFNDEPASELGSILRRAADRMELGTLPPFFLYDVTGKRCGEATAT